MIDDEVKITTSVYLFLRQKKWIDERGYVLSDFVRLAVDEKINSMAGYIVDIEKTRDRIKNLEEDLKIQKEKLIHLEQKQEEFDETINMENINSLIVRAITNIDYSGWEEAAKDLEDLRGTLQIETWENLVRERWEELYGE